jgi:hypothetical protein
MNSHHVFIFLQRGEVLATAARSSDPGRLAWVGVYPLDLSSPRTAEFLRNEGIIASSSTQPVCHIRYFEVDKDLIERDLSIGENELVKGRSLFAFGAVDLAAKLKSLGVELEELERPFRSDYPI